MEKIYVKKNHATRFCTVAQKSGIVSILAFLLLNLFSLEMKAQETYTLGTGTTSYSTLGINPFSTINRSSRSQYLYYGQELLELDAISGNIISISFFVSQLGQPLSLKPENLKIKMAMTSLFVLPTTLIPNLPVYYESTTENINATGWYKFTLQTPFEWNGYSNIIVEVCRTNQTFGSSYEIQATQFFENDYRTTGLYTNELNQNGCSLSGATPMVNINRRRRPNLQVEMTSPCVDLPSAGVTVVTAGQYCSGEEFTLSIQGGSIESGLFYQWQSSPNDNGPWTDISGANNTTYSTSQSISTWYRRTTTCIETQLTINDQALLVGGDGCYCTALVVNENEVGITNVSLQSINNTSDTSAAYSSFTNIQTELERQVTYNLTVNVNTEGGTNYTRAWIDWNQNAEFEASELYELGNVTGGTNVNSGAVASITVPTNAPLGSTIMRVRTSQSASNDLPTPCDPIQNGEAEDYVIVVLANFSVDDFTSNFTSLQIAVSNDMKLKVANEIIENVTIYDLSGRIVYTEANLQNEVVTLTNFKPLQQFWIVKVKTESGGEFTKNIIF
ncbi:GEVED domain-containing protein [Flavobacterium sp.]|jgi:hypothetical protein|uniref:GEVED domain-containing protein n=1 Tax=Flavobacterium sp. TaxID=239 RepID=UPI0037BF8215